MSDAPTRKLTYKGNAQPGAQRNSAQGVEKGFSKRVSVDHKKQKMLEHLKAGYTVEDAEKLIGHKPGIYKYYRKTDAEFKMNADRILTKRDLDYQPAQAGEFPDFSEKFLKQRLFRHQLQWVDLLEGRDPRDLHPSQRYEAGDPNFVIINTPPEHAKSTTITMNYITYRICKDPGVRVIVVSKTQGMAKKFLHGIKQRLTSNRYADLIQAFAPTDGFDKGTGSSWRADQIYVSAGDTSEGTAEKDPTVEAIGIGGQIYGARADLIILDDCVTLDNVGQVEDQIEWIQQEVMSRLGAFGRLIVVGTRVSSVDLYTELMNPKRYPSERSSWTYLSQPAVLEITDDPKSWVTLWPKSNQPMKGDTSAEPDGDGLVPFWTGPLMHRIRERIQPRTWAMVYMQQQVDEEAVFDPKAVQGCVNGMRYPGALHASTEGGTVGTMDKGSDWYIVAGLDPATVSGYTACTVLAFNRRTQKRRIVDVSNKRMTPDAMINLIKDFTVRYEVDEWRVEKNGFQAFLTQSREITQYLASRGVLLREHSTYGNKHDPGFGVAAMAMLFRGWQDGNNMIELPRKDSEGIKALIEQLITWAPDIPKTQKTDTVMSLWFAEIRAKEMVTQLGDTHYSDDTSWLSDNDKEARVVLNIDDYLAAQREESRTFYAV